MLAVLNFVGAAFLLALGVIALSGPGAIATMMTFFGWSRAVAYQYPPALRFELAAIFIAGASFLFFTGIGLLETAQLGKGAGSLCVCSITHNGRVTL